MAILSSESVSNAASPLEGICIQVIVASGMAYTLHMRIREPSGDAVDSVTLHISNLSFLFILVLVMRVLIIASFPGLPSYIAMHGKNAAKKL